MFLSKTGKAEFQMRHLLTCLIVTYAALFAGCMKPIDSTESPIRPINPDSHSDESPPQGIAVSVAVPPDAWRWISAHTPKHSITINEAIDIKDAGGVALAIKAGTTMSIVVADDSAELTFSKPFPTARKIGITLDVKSVQLKPDGTGVARTAIRNWAFRWADSPTEEAGTPPPAMKAARRVVWIFTAAWCQPCKVLRSNLESVGVVTGDTDDATIRWVDVNAHPELWDWYARRDNRIPQAAFFEGDKLIGSPIVSPTVEAIEAHIKKGKE